VAPGIAEEEFEDSSLYQLLERRYGLVPVSAHERHWAALLERSQARLLQVAAGSAGLCAERVALLRDGRPLEYTRSVMRADRYQITLDLVSGSGVLRPAREVLSTDASGGSAAASGAPRKRRRRM
jgi:GntR family transcriptional regulator